MATPADTIVRMNAPARLWRLDCRGSFALWDGDGRLVTIRGRKARAILAYLVTYRHEHVTRERLIQLLWPDRAMAQARGSLRQSLVEIRRAAPGVIISDHEHVWIDMTRLEPIELADNCSPAEQLFDDLEGITSEFDDWLRCERATEASEKWVQLQRLVEGRLKRGEGASAIPLIERMQRIDPYNEEWLRLAMRADAQAGHPAGIQTRFRELNQLLKHDLDVSLAPQTRALHDELLRDLAKPNGAVDVEVEQTIVARTQSQPSNDRAASRWAFRLPTLVAVGFAALAATLGLTQSVRPAPVEPNRIAVLPFRALDGADSALAEGMADEVLSDLSQHDGIQTVGRTSSWMFKDKGEDLRRVGRKLDVRYVVEGSLRQSQGALRLNVALIDTRDASMLWSGRFASPSGDAQRMEGAASSAILQHLGLKMISTDRRTDPRAYAMYVRAKSIIRARDWENFDEARKLLIQALKLDPSYAPAWAQLGGVINFRGSWSSYTGQRTDREWHEQALAAAQRSIALDPKLAEGHQMLAFIHGFDTNAGRAHLAHALKLQPRDSQTLYWWGLTVQGAGHSDLAEQVNLKALALDPLWKRPIELAGKFAIENGRRGDANVLVARLRPTDPGAAIEMEMAFADLEGDFSRVVQIGRDPRNRRIFNGTEASGRLAVTLNQLGYVREALMVDVASPFQRSLQLRKLPDIATIMAQTQATIGTAQEHPLIWTIILELARTNRHSDIASLYDRPGFINDLKRIEPGNRSFRAGLGGIVGEALRRTSRGAEAAQLFRGANEARDVILNNRNVSSETLVQLALNEAIMHRRERAVRLLDRAVGRGWLLISESNYRLSDLPWPNDIRADPRFQRLVRTTEAKIAEERRETEALGLI
jgi:TolB-like protein/DNA-binding SARP family transcriptional activator